MYTKVNSKSQMRLEEEIRVFTKSIKYYSRKRKKKKVKLGKKRWKEIGLMNRAFSYQLYKEN